MTDSYAAYYEPGPNWLKGKPLNDQPLKSHVDYLVSLHEQGKLSMGGPLADGSGGLVVSQQKAKKKSRHCYRQIRLSWTGS